MKKQPKAKPVRAWVYQVKAQTCRISGVIRIWNPSHLQGCASDSYDHVAEAILKKWMEASSQANLDLFWQWVGDEYPLFESVLITAIKTLLKGWPE